ncbi:serine/threonine protein kinase [Streptomyces thermoalcalitolerans]|uniref:Protein kinase domain-containing protein n=1 Tax=Streptomyces thermoalcalitolerans TaxID=65605 RepID=A0ABN1NTE9_9ACTN
MTEPYAVPVPRGYRVGVWEVRRPLATGAFGSVYEGRRVGGDETLPHTAALKFLPTGTGTPRRLAHLRELVEREVALHRRLRRPRLIRMYETLTVDDPDRPGLDGATVLVLEKAEGSLAALLAADPRPAAGPVLLAQICEGLDQLHRAGWVHGDLKPANVLLMADGSARLADFNLAAELEDTHAYTPAFSTPDYTPPELLWSEIGERGRRIRPSADIWAFGVLAHLVLTGSFPLPGGTPAARRDAAVAYARGSDELRLSPELPDAWREIVCACLTRTHAGRIGTGALLRRTAAAAGTVRTPRLPGLRRISRPLKPLGIPGTPKVSRTTGTPRVRGVVLGAVLATTAVAVLGYGIGTQGHRPPGAQGAPRTATPAPAVYGASELRTDRGIPPVYRPLIVDAAHACRHPDITPALIAAMLKAESNFDPDLYDPVHDEYGIARWTPRVLRWWMRADGLPTASIPEPPFSPAVSISAMGHYLCFIASHLEPDLPGDRRVLIAAAYRTSYKKVNEAGGVPPKERDHCARVAHHLKEYTPPGKR